MANGTKGTEEPIYRRCDDVAPHGWSELLKPHGRQVAIADAVIDVAIVGAGPSGSATDMFEHDVWGLTAVYARMGHRAGAVIADR